MSLSGTGYRPVDELLNEMSFRVLRAVRRFDWVEPSQLAIALDMPASDINPKLRNHMDVMVSRLTRLGYLERIGETAMTRAYRITDKGSAEYKRQLARNAA